MVFVEYRGTVINCHVKKPLDLLKLFFPEGDKFLLKEIKILSYNGILLDYIDILDMETMSDLLASGCGGNSEDAPIKLQVPSKLNYV